MMSKIQELIEAEIERRVNEKVTTFAEKVSKNYRIPLPILLRDFGSTTEVVKGSDCLGVCANGKRCTFRSVADGYCKKHQGQKKKVEPIEVASTPTLVHTHSVPPLFCEDCPACKKTQTSRKPLIDLGGLIGK